MLNRTVIVEFTPTDIGDYIAFATDMQQRELLLAWASALENIEASSWDMQCLEIAAGLPAPDKMKIVSVLQTLIDYLEIN